MVSIQIFSINDFKKGKPIPSFDQSKKFILRAILSSILQVNKLPRSMCIEYSQPPKILCTNTED